MHNPTVETLKNLQLVPVSDPGVIVSVKPLALDQLAAHASTSWEVRITKQPDGPVSTGVYFPLRYVIPTKDAGLVPGAVVGKLEVQDAPLEPMDKIAEAHIETTLETLQEQQTGELYLVV